MGATFLETPCIAGCCQLAVMFSRRPNIPKLQIVNIVIKSEGYKEQIL